MKFLILNTDYAEFLRWLYAQYPGLEKQPYEEQMRARVESLFGVADFYSSNLCKLGHEAWDIHGNNEFMQKAWAQEHGIRIDPSTPTAQSLRKILQRAGRIGANNMVYGLIRREVLGQSGRFRNVWGADHALLAELALRGSFAQIAEPLFLRRKNRPDEEDETRKRRVLYSLDTMNADEKYKTSFEDLFLQLCHKHLQILACAPISFLDKLRGAIATVACFKYRFGAQWRSLSFVERVVPYFIPKKIRRKILLKLQGP
ncbi:MAG: hypothetical protein A2253_08330 [Deltaproteobacteria bacterium RIFOXYA2_FULL_55_11]|nr:MAG: hypothetical protein A2253_08330 [Deltaproteobacteria bacterium RIFOXYA2_FULL_55_11]